MQITATTVVDYARHRKLIGPDETPRVEPLAGGVAGVVFRLHAARGAIVVKQSEERFRVKETWIVDPQRNRLEAEVQQQARLALGAQHVPAVIDIDRDNHIFTMESAALEARSWKTLLMAGQVDPTLGPQCARLLTAFRGIDPAVLPVEVRDPRFFYQQRLEPYFEFTARKHPEVAALIPRLKQQVGVTHGDFTPKNFLVSAGTLILLDYEVTCLNWPAFDVASLVNHLTLKMFHLPASRPALQALAREFLQTLTLELPLLGALLLARVDGKSPAEYLREEDKPRIREAGKRLLRGDFASYEAFQTGTF